MFKIFKNKNPNCYGDFKNLSIECHDCECKIKCLDYINRNSSGTFYLPTNEPVPNLPMKRSKLNKVT